MQLRRVARGAARPLTRTLRRFFPPFASRWLHWKPYNSTPTAAAAAEHAVAESTPAESGLTLKPGSWPQGRHQAGGGKMKAARQQGQLIWAVQPGSLPTFSLRIPGCLSVEQVALEGRRVVVELNGEEVHSPQEDLDGQVAVIFEDARGATLPAAWYSWNQRHSIRVPHEARRMRLALRVVGAGTVRFTGLRIVTVEEPEELPPHWSKDRVLLLVPAYPSYDDLYAFGFVHSRVRAYQGLGLEVDVMVPIPGKRQTHREFEGIPVLEGSEALLKLMLDSGRYDAVAVHFLKPYLWAILEPYVAQIPITVWVHGSDIRPWWRQRHLIESPAKEAWYQKHTAQLMEMWREVLNAPGSRMQFVFPSHAFAEESRSDLAQFGLELEPSRTIVIPNGVDTELFAYQPKDPEQRKRILMIRTFQNRNYGTDLAADAIRQLTAEPWFSDLEFLVVGDGPLWEQDMAPLAEIENVHFRREFLTHHQMVELQREYGVMLLPTRLDSQGVSRDEAMAGGLVVISHAVSAVPEFLSEQEGYLVAPEDSTGIVAALRDLYYHPEIFLAKSQAAAQRVRRDLELKDLIRTEIELIKEPAHA